MSSTPTPLTREQEVALLRFLGGSARRRIEMAAPESHYVPNVGATALKLKDSYALPGARMVRYGISGATIFVADVKA
jgi:hypothetical protein